MIMRDYVDFMDHVGIIHDADFFAEMGLFACDENAFFAKEQLPELIEFCNRNYEFHIVTDTDDFERIKGCAATMMNHVGTGPNVRGYYLANGDINEVYLQEDSNEIPF